MFSKFLNYLRLRFYNIQFLDPKIQSKLSRIIIEIGTIRFVLHIVHILCWNFVTSSSTLLNDLSGTTSSLFAIVVLFFCFSAWEECIPSLKSSKAHISVKNIFILASNGCVYVAIILVSDPRTARVESTFSSSSFASSRTTLHKESRPF